MSLVVLFLALATVAPVVADDVFLPELRIGACEKPGFERPLRCGTLTVLENPANPDGRRISLHLIVLPARDGIQRSEAVLYLVGGPGGAATDSIRFLADNLSSIQESRDVVLVDQRGTGGSGRLECRLSHRQSLEATVAGRIPASLLETCLETLDADPVFYTTAASADDLDAVRRALGYERVDLVGVSYGSRLALVYLRRYPTRVRTVALRGVASPAGNVLADLGRASEQVMARLLARCSEDPGCAREHPELGTKLKRALARLAARPVEIPFESPDGDKRSLELTRDLAAGALRYALYSDRSASRIPKLIEELDRGQWNTLATLLHRGLAPSAAAVSIGLYLSVVCAEDMPFLDPAEESFGRVFLTPSVIDNIAAACRAWPHAPVPADFKKPVRSDVPVLLMSGTDDPATSPETAEEVGRFLSRSRHLVTPGLSHFPTWTNCFARNTALLQKSGSIETLDPGCADDFVRAGFRQPQQ